MAIGSDAADLRQRPGEARDCGWRHAGDLDVRGHAAPMVGSVAAASSISRCHHHGAAEMRADPAQHGLQLVRKAVHPHCTGLSQHAARLAAGQGHEPVAGPHGLPSASGRPRSLGGRWGRGSRLLGFGLRLRLHQVEVFGARVSADGRVDEERQDNSSGSAAAERSRSDDHRFAKGEGGDRSPARPGVGAYGRAVRRRCSLAVRPAASS